MKGLSGWLLACFALLLVWGAGCEPSANPECTGGRTACDGQCVDTSQDPRNCGECGAVCPVGGTCAGRLGDLLNWMDGGPR